MQTQPWNLNAWILNAFALANVGITLTRHTLQLPAYPCWCNALAVVRETPCPKCLVGSVAGATLTMFLQVPDLSRRSGHVAHSPHAPPHEEEPAWKSKGAQILCLTTARASCASDATATPQAPEPRHLVHGGH